MSANDGLSGMGAALAALLPPDAPQEVRDTVALHGDNVPLHWLADLMTDANMARRALELGDREGARTILSGWRDRAEQLGVLPIYEQMIGAVIASDEQSG